MSETSAQDPFTPTRPDPTRPSPARTTTPHLHEPLRRAREFQNATDPCQRIHDALTNHGCQPVGPAHSFRSRCPGHDSNNLSLKVTEGADRRVLLRCHVGCEPGRIVDALGMRLSDLFPPGHRSGHNRKPRPSRAVAPGAAFMDTLSLAGVEWMATLMLNQCPYCLGPNCFVKVHNRGHVEVLCGDGCDFVAFKRAVETLAAIREKGLGL